MLAEPVYARSVLDGPDKVVLLHLAGGWVLLPVTHGLGAVHLFVAVEHELAVQHHDIQTKGQLSFFSGLFYQR